MDREGTPPGSITSAVNRLAAGEQLTQDEVFSLVYDELRRRAGSRLKGDAVGAMLAPTELVHAVYERMFGSGEISWQNRRHFFGCAARLMGQIMIDAARRARVSGRAIPKLAARAAAASDQNPGNSNQGFDTEAFEQALGDLEAQDAQAAEIFRLRVFLGLTAAECAMAIGVSERTVFREWQLSCAYLAERIEK